MNREGPYPFGLTGGIGDKQEPVQREERRTS